MSFPGAAGRDGSASGSDPGSDPVDSASSDHGFPRTRRLTTRRQFLTVHEKGRRVSSASFTLLGLSNAHGTSRLGITVTRRVAGAVGRNRVKRVLREIFRRNRAALRPPVDLVIVARTGIEERTLVELEKELLKRFKELVRRLEP